MVAESLPHAVIARIAAVLGGEELYQTKADKDCVLKTYHFARNQLKEGRVNVRLKSEFPKRLHTFLPRHSIDAAISTDDCQKTLETYFPESPSPDESKRIYDMFKAVQSYAKNDAGSTYKRQFPKIPSGTYTDEDILKDILESAHKTSINQNMTKALNGFTNKWLRDKHSKKEEVSLEDKLVYTAKMSAELKPTYDDKKKHALRDRDIPHDHIVWVFCGQPGLNLDSINATVQAKGNEVPPKGPGGRRAGRGGEENNDGIGMLVSDKVCEIRKLNAIKLREVAVQGTSNTYTNTNTNTNPNPNPNPNPIPNPNLNRSPNPTPTPTPAENVDKRMELKTGLEALRELKLTVEVDSTQWKVYQDQYLEVLKELASGLKRKAPDDDSTRRLEFINTGDGTPRAEDGTPIRQESI